MYSELSDVSTDSGRPRTAIPQEPLLASDITCRPSFVRFCEMRNPRSKERRPRLASGGRIPLKSHSSERPNSREGNPPLTGNQARKDLIESEPPESRKAGKHAEEIGSERSDRVGNARPKGSARRKARKGEYKGSVRSLRTQQRAKSQRQIC